jgi:hypothetical protein
VHGCVGWFQNVGVLIDLGRGGYIGLFWNVGVLIYLGRGGHIGLFWNVGVLIYLGRGGHMNDLDLGYGQSKTARRWVWQLEKIEKMF